jgi:hypothetical protein
MRFSKDSGMILQAIDRCQEISQAELNSTIYDASLDAPPMVPSCYIQ